MGEQAQTGRDSSERQAAGEASFKPCDAREIRGLRNRNTPATESIVASHCMLSVRRSAAVLLCMLFISRRESYANAN